MLVNRDRAAGQHRSPWHPLDLQHQVLKAYRVISVDRALVLQREDQVQVLARHRDKIAAAFAPQPPENGD
jgi:hypothetical protein